MIVNRKINKHFTYGAGMKTLRMPHFIFIIYKVFHI